MRLSKSHPHVVSVSAGSPRFLTIKAWCSRMFGQELKGIEEMHKSPWLARRYGDTEAGPTYNMYFKREEDALLFALRWS